MLAQFQVRYPTGSLISELLTIYQGKFVVRVLAQVEGVLRATGMAASESLELAEDQARNRALMVLGIEPKPIEAAEVAREAEQDKEEQQEIAFVDNLSQQSSPAPSDLFSWYQEPQAPLENGMTSDVQTETSSNPLMSFSNVTPLVPRSYSQDTGAVAPVDAKTNIEAEPIDLSDAIARTTVELKRLGWSNQQGREYLKNTYNKRSRPELTDEELLEFLHYLESQPSPQR